MMQVIETQAVEILGQQAAAERLERLLNLSLEELMNEQIITAGKTSEKISNIPASVVIVNRQDIKTYGYNTLGEILEHVSGLYMFETYEIQGSKNYGVRGFFNATTNRNMVILVNGVNQTFDHDATSRLPRVAVPVEAIDRIEIVRGPMSVIYGSGAFFGVINIITNRVDKDEKPINLVAVSAGSPTTRKAIARVSAAQKEWSYVVNASSYYDSGIDQPYSKMQTTPSAGVAGLSSGGRLEHHENYFDLTATYQDFSLGINQVRSETEGFFPTPSLKQGTLTITEATNLHLGYRHEFNDNLRLEAHADYFDMNVHYNYDQISLDFVGDQTQRAYGYETEVDVFWKINPRLDLTTGLHYRNVLDVSNRFDLPYFNRPSTTRVERGLVGDETIATQALFTQANYQLSDKLKLVAGVRFERLLPYNLYGSQASGTPDYSYTAGEYKDSKDTRIIPRLAAIYSFNDKNVLKLLYGEAINRPAFSQNVSAMLNPEHGNLQPEYIKTLELNYISELAEGYISNLSLFRNKFNNLITRQSIQTPNGDYKTYSDNGGKLVTNGIEWTVQTKPLDNWDVELSAIYQKTKDKMLPDIEVPYSPNWLGQLKTAYHFKENRSFALMGYYVGGMSTYYDVTLKNPDGSHGRNIGNSSDGYFLLGANLRFDKLFGKGGFANLHLYNLLDKEVIYPAETTNSWANKGTIGTGRTFTLSVGYEF
ncbi:MAG: TonB-dependent receptor [Thiotrichaceae bacterium]